MAMAASVVLAADHGRGDVRGPAAARRVDGSLLRWVAVRHGLRVRDLTVRFGATVAVDHVDLAVPGRVGGRRARPVGVRQVHPAARGGRSRGARLRHRGVRRTRPRRRPDPQARVRADVPGRPALRAPRRRRQHRLPAAAAPPPAATASQRERVAELLDLVGLRGTPTGCRPPCPAASASGSPSPARWPSSRGCSCSTSRSAPSTAGCASGSPASCTTSCARPGRPRCWSPTTRRRRSRSPTGWP